MFKKLFFGIILSCFASLQAQEVNTLYQTKKIAVTRDTIHLEKSSINSDFFELLDSKNNPIDLIFYTINPKKGILILNEKFPFNTDSITAKYLKLPHFLTKEYSIYDSSRVVSNQIGSENLYKTETNFFKKNIPFDGLNTSGSISRGFTVGNNQNTVLNSNLDLQITGKISEKVSLRASIQDNNIPLQDGGYSQKLDQFDNVFMELFSDKWSIRAGDVFLENRKNQFLNFNKKAQGIATNFNLGTENNKTNLFASAALVRGQYAKSSFIGQESNQGPYKLKGQNGELYVLVISGSERVYVNGILLKRGENNDYIIDYNAGEIIFTSLYPINSEMRITIEYQYSDRNFNRFITYLGGTHEDKNWSFGSYLYSESDIKNQPLQQDLSEDQVQTLANAGDNQKLMIAPSAYVDTYSDNKVLYKKTNLNGLEFFEFSNDSKEELYNVRFSLIGDNKGNYILKNVATLGRVYEFIAPVNSIPQGNYAPLIQLVAPVKIQIATFFGKYNPTEKTAIDFEIGISNNDKNLFSSKDDGNNQGLALKINANQRLYSKNWNIDAFAKYQFVQQNFSSVERLYSIEFDRDWNIGTATVSNQSYLISGMNFNHPEKGNVIYQFEKLDFDANFSGNRHVINGTIHLKNWKIQNLGSYLNSDAIASTSKFLRNQTHIQYHFNKNWIGSSLRLEDNQEKNKTTNAYSALSQRYSEYGLYAGRGDSTKVYAELGFLKRTNDSLQNGFIQHVNNSQSFYLKSKLIQNNKSDLSVYMNYRVLDFVDVAKKNEPSLNSRLIYNDRFFNQFIQSTTVYETNSGSIAQQEFTYLEVPAGQGVYTWNDYNSNGVQELQEFEVAVFIDQAKFIRVFLPNQIYIKTHQNKFSQSITLNPNQWQNESGFRKILSYFYNQTAFITDQKIKSDGDNFDLNPFSTTQENTLGLNTSFRNSLFYNRGKQKHSTTYSYLQNNNNYLLSIGSQENKNSSHQIQYTHLYKKSWLINSFVKTINAATTSENFPEKNYVLKGFQLAPKISYLFSKNTSWDLFYELQNKENQIGNFETLIQNKFGTSFSYLGSKKITLNGELSFYQNKFSGNELSSVGFQMLEGLQAGQNFTWKLLLQKNITQFLDVNFNYQGRKGETSQTIHTGSVQLRAYF